MYAYKISGFLIKNYFTKINNNNTNLQKKNGKKQPEKITSLNLQDTIVI